MALPRARRWTAYFAIVLALVLPTRPLSGKDRPGSRSAVQNAAARRSAARPFSAERFIQAFRSRSEEAKLETLTQAERLFTGRADAKRVDRQLERLKSADSTTRLGHATCELLQVVYGLPDGTMFNPVAYNRTLRVWREQLVSADRSSKSESLRFLYSLYPDSKTACYDTLERALALDPNLELIVFLSDGGPNAGRVTGPARIVREISVCNATTRAQVDVLGIDAQGEAERFLKELAAANHGRYRAIR